MYTQAAMSSIHPRPMMRPSRIASTDPVVTREFTGSSGGGYPYGAAGQGVVYGYGPVAVGSGPGTMGVAGTSCGSHPAPALGFFPLT